jgi:hypothetical protein
VTGIAVRYRLPVLAFAGLALAAGLYGALLLLGFAIPAPRPSWADVHGPLMVLGFVGTLVALERAVALSARWGLAAPACSGIGALALTGRSPVRWFLAALALLVAGATAATLWPHQGAYVFGIAVLAMVAWLVIRSSTSTVDVRPPVGVAR